MAMNAVAFLRHEHFGHASSSISEKVKDPSEASLGSGTHARTARALGSGGLEGARHLFNLSRIAFRILYQIAHRDTWPRFGAGYPQSGNVSRFAQFPRWNKPYGDKSPTRVPSGVGG
jgi:hypothetical protein